MPENIIPTSTQHLVNSIDQVFNYREFNVIEENEIKPYIETIKSELTKLKTIAQENLDTLDKDQAFKMIFHLQSAQATAQLLTTYISASLQRVANQALSSVSTWVTGTLISWLKNLGSSIWAVIQNLTTPTEWKIKGGLGSSAFGLANAELEITFG